MSQIGNKLKAGFFATPPRQGEYLRQLLTFTADTAVLDPTCGEGTILKQLSEDRDGREFTVKTYGVELDKRRALAAGQTLDVAWEAPIESMVISNDAFGFVFLNPPYDHTMVGYGDEHSERKEYTELVRGTRYLAPGGVIMYIIPSYRFSDKKIARFLATNFEDSFLTRFTDEDYPEFRQCIFIGRKKKEKRKTVNELMLEQLADCGSEDFVIENVMTVDKLVAMDKPMLVPATKTEVTTFYSRIEKKSEFISMIQGNKGFTAFKERTKPKKLSIGGEPIINIAQGQMALLLASGAVNGLIGTGDNLHAVQGMEKVSKEVTQETTEHSVITKSRTKREVSVKIITPQGKVRKLV
ncbi:DUF6094 domain-containing protein [Planomicrobium okeanokoites]|uniref:DUF6094 domain-containing protein n=1 Tax=Planomicrobium okeanokoites TaxID=244 RepID=UPI001FD402A6|nr:DUF6094 domain-containing protein [Planomicrobium okeanokoites]